ncbi:MAG: rimM, partial [Acidobacteria bacterium]|nr:rimM [Acidobacteriota bacterium]
MVVVGRIARPHGLRGQVAVTPETDFVAERFRPGATVWVRSAGREAQLTIASARMQNGRPVIGFEGLSSIEAVERLAGLELRV